ncbi:MAG: patatin-like phospholipase family protein [Burkholderiaceae bacterium]
MADVEAAPAGRGLALALSGGGFRASLFHAGALIRLNELGLVSRLSAVSGVSGGAVIAGILASRWCCLPAPDANGVIPGFAAAIVNPLRAFALQSFGLRAWIRGLFPGRTQIEALADHYRDRLHMQTGLTDLPARPAFSFLATDLDSGGGFVFARDRTGVYHDRPVIDPDYDLATAVACSCAAPLIFAAAHLPRRSKHHRLPPAGSRWARRVPGGWLLSDGGVYDNLGLEPIWKRGMHLLVSDAGMRLPAFDEARPGVIRNLPRNLMRNARILDAQNRAMRARHLFAMRERDAYREAAARGPESAGSSDRDLLAQYGYRVAYWGTFTPIDEYRLCDALRVDPDRQREIAMTKTTLDRIDPDRQAELINLGYALSDAAVRRWAPSLPERRWPPRWPEPDHRLDGLPT